MRWFLAFVLALLAATAHAEPVDRAAALAAIEALPAVASPAPAGPSPFDAREIVAISPKVYRRGAVNNITLPGVTVVEHWSASGQLKRGSVSFTYTPIAVGPDKLLFKRGDGKIELYDVYVY